MSDLQKEIYAILCNMSGEEVANALSNFYGNQIFTEEFKQFLIDEGE